MSFGSLSLKGKALQCLSQREHSRAELQKKLRRHTAQLRRQSQATPGEGAEAATEDEVDAENAKHSIDIEKVLDDLVAAGLQSDARTAESVARSKSSRYGVHRLRQQLQAKGLEAELVAHTVSQTRDTEFERALSLWRRRFGEASQDQAQRARQIRFLTARGFDSDVVRRIVRGGLETD